MSRLSDLAAQWREVGAASDAQEDINERHIAAGITEETPEWKAANDRTNAAIEALPKWARRWA